MGVEQPVKKETIQIEEEENLFAEFDGKQSNTAINPADTKMQPEKKISLDEDIEYARKLQE